MRNTLIVSHILALAVASASCTPQHAATESSAEIEPKTQHAGAVELSGQVVKMGWTKSFESWDAGGSEYYVFLVDQPSEFPQRMILRPSDRVRFEEFDQFAGKHVSVLGEKAVPEPFVPPKDWVEQVPSGPDGPPLRGSGFKVNQIRSMPLERAPDSNP